jgi:hypothetical protein
MTVGVFVGVLVGVFVGVLVGVKVGSTTVQVRIAGVESIFPATSVLTTWKVCNPSARLSVAKGETQSSISTSSRAQAKVAPASLDEKVKVAEVSLTVPDGPELIDVLGGVLSTVTTRLVERVGLKVLSTARAVRLTGPSLTVVEFQIQL